MNPKCFYLRFKKLSAKGESWETSSSLSSDWQFAAEGYLASADFLMFTQMCFPGFRSQVISSFVCNRTRLGHRDLYL